MDGFLGEFLGTMILILLGTGINAGVNLKGTFANKNGDWLLITFGWGMAVTMGVYVAGHFGSAAHLNPAVTLSFALFGMFSWQQVFPYLVAQFLGAFIGATLVIVQFYPHFKISQNAAAGNKVEIFATGPAINNRVFNFLSEVIATFAFVFILLSLGDFSTGLKPLVVGFVILAIGISLGTTTGYAINPARDWGPRLAYTILPVPHRGITNWSYAWIPMLGPIVGASIAAGVYKIA